MANVEIYQGHCLHLWFSNNCNRQTDKHTEGQAHGYSEIVQICPKIRMIFSVQDTYCSMRSLVSVWVFWGLLQQIFWHHADAAMDRSIIMSHPREGVTTLWQVWQVYTKILCMVHVAKQDMVNSFALALTYAAIQSHFFVLFLFRL